jgi:hypothetical protein
MPSGDRNGRPAPVGNGGEGSCRHVEGWRRHLVGSGWRFAARSVQCRRHGGGPVPSPVGRRRRSQRPVVDVTAVVLKNVVNGRGLIGKASLPGHPSARPRQFWGRPPPGGSPGCGPAEAAGSAPCSTVACATRCIRAAQGATHSTVLPRRWRAAGPGVSRPAACPSPTPATVWCDESPATWELSPRRCDVRRVVAAGARLIVDSRPRCCPPGPAGGGTCGARPICWPPRAPARSAAGRPMARRRRALHTRGGDGPAAARRLSPAGPRGYRGARGTSGNLTVFRPVIRRWPLRRREVCRRRRPAGLRRRLANGANLIADTPRHVTTMRCAPSHGGGLRPPAAAGGRRPTSSTPSPFARLYHCPWSLVWPRPSGGSRAPRPPAAHRGTHRIHVHQPLPTTAASL